MRNWHEMYMYGRERASELTNLSESIRMARMARNLSRLREKTAEIVRGVLGQESPTAGGDRERARATFIMERGEVLSIRVGRRPYRIVCIAGRLWTTMDGSTVDTVLIAGEFLAYRGRGKVVIQALRTATVRVECPSAARVFLSSPLRPVFQFR